MANDFHYVPLLKAKEGEFLALRLLSVEARASMTPLLEAPPLEGYGELEPPAGAVVDNQLQRLPQKIARAWGTGSRFFLDLGLVDCDAALAGGEQPLTYVFEHLRKLGLQGVPVTALNRASAYQDAISSIARSDGRGVCFRLLSEDLEDPESAVRDTLDCLDGFDLAPTDTDLLLDLGEIGASVGPSALVIDVTLRTLAERDHWRSITVAATAFPTVSEYGADSVNVAQRYEWDLWRRVRARNLPRIPDFGDYGIFGAQTAGTAGEFAFAPSPNIRYTTDDEWLILKARSPRRYGHEQYNALCADLVGRPEYAGPDFSWADGYIARCARDQDGPGNATKWIQASTNHHITAVVDQLANLDAP